MGSNARKKKKERARQAGEQSSHSLEEMLEKHWTRRRWDGYVNVFVRRPGTAAQVPGARERFNKALRNLLQTQVFVDRDPEGLELTLQTLSRCRSEAAPFVEAETARCICLCGALAHFAATGRLDGCLPPQTPAFKALFEELSAERPARQPPAEDRAAVAKLQKGFARLAGARSTSPFTSFLKLAEEFAGERWSNPRAQDRAVFAGAMREAAGARSAFASGFSEAARRLAAMAENPSFTACPELWPHFLRFCQEKFGRQWNAGAMRLAFSMRLGDSPRAARQIQIFTSGAEAAHRGGAHDPTLGGLKKLLQRPDVLSAREFCLAGLLYFALLPRTDTSLADAERSERGPAAERRPELLGAADTVALLLDVADKSASLRGGARQPEEICTAFEQAARLGVLARDEALRARFAGTLAGLPAKTRLVCALGAGTPMPGDGNLHIDGPGLESLACAFVAWTRNRRPAEVKETFRDIAGRLAPDCRPGFASSLCREAATLGFAMPFAWMSTWGLRQWDPSWRGRHNPEDYEDETVFDTYGRAAGFWHALDGSLRDAILAVLPERDPAAPLIALAGDEPMTVRRGSCQQDALDAGFPAQIYLGLWYWCCEREGASATFLSRLCAKANPLVEESEEWDLLVKMIRRLPRERTLAAAEGLWAYWSRRRRRDRGFAGAREALARILGRPV